nr:MAG TPA: hypothetical protein [Caudoviricetes sp.]
MLLRVAIRLYRTQHTSSDTRLRKCKRKQPLCSFYHPQYERKKL